MNDRIWTKETFILDDFLRREPLPSPKVRPTLNSWPTGRNIWRYFPTGEDPNSSTSSSSGRIHLIEVLTNTSIYINIYIYLNSINQISCYRGRKHLKHRNGELYHCLHSTPSFLFALRNFESPTVTYSSGCLDIEKKALLKFKDGLRDDTDCCKWAGISCDNRTAQVIRLTVHESGGEINPSLLELKHLNSLDLSMNNFEGNKIPSFIGSFQKLRYLNLSRSSFGGLIPPHLGNLSSLFFLDLKSYANEPIENDIKWISSLSSLRYLI